MIVKDFLMPGALNLSHLQAYALQASHLHRFASPCARLLQMIPAALFTSGCIFFLVE